MTRSDVVELALTEVVHLVNAMGDLMNKPALCGTSRKWSGLMPRKGNPESMWVSPYEFNRYGLEGFPLCPACERRVGSDTF